MEKFENQYLLYTKNRNLERINHWYEFTFQDYHLMHCPKLNSYEHKTEESHCMLLGFAFHALEPSWKEEEILSNIPKDRSSFLNYLDCLCGNFLLFVEIEGDLVIYTDASATLKFFYVEEGDKVVGAGPDPAILKEYFGIVESRDEDVLEFYNSDYFINNHIRLGNKSIFEKTQQLLPNHKLSLKKNAVERYFPRIEREELPLNKALEKVHYYFSNILEAAAERFDLKCSITAGWDSRMVISMTKKYHDQVEYYTFINPPFKKSHPDVSVSKKIADRLHLNYKQLERPIVLSDKEIEDAKASFRWLGEHNIQALLGGFSGYNEPDQLLLIGNVSEICKNYFEDVQITNGKVLTQAAHFPVLKYTLDHFEQLYKEHKELEQRFKYDMRDIVHWEQDICNFAAMGILYRSLVTKAFSPFNCRLVIDTILRTKREYRDKQQHLFYNSYIEKYYPELNAFGVNPDLKSRLIVISKKIGVYKRYKALSTKLRK